MEQEERKIVSDLERDIAIQSTACGKNCRHVVYAIIGVTWGFFINEGNLWDRFALSIIMLVGIAYLMIDTWRYYSTAKRARELYEKADELNDELIDAEMTRQSNWAFSVLQKQMYACAVMTSLLAIYVILKYLL